jgi:hypothetical protein
MTKLICLIVLLAVGAPTVAEAHPSTPRKVTGKSDRPKVKIFRDHGVIYTVSSWTNDIDHAIARNRAPFRTR